MPSGADLALDRRGVACATTGPRAALSSCCRGLASCLPRCNEGLGSKTGASGSATPAASQRLPRTRRPRRNEGSAARFFARADESRSPLRRRSWRAVRYVRVLRAHSSGRPQAVALGALSVRLHLRSPLGKAVARSPHAVGELLPTGARDRQFEIYRSCSHRCAQDPRTVRIPRAPARPERPAPGWVDLQPQAVAVVRVLRPHLRGVRDL